MGLECALEEAFTFTYRAVQVLMNQASYTVWFRSVFERVYRYREASPLPRNQTSPKRYESFGINSPRSSISS